uniref:Cytochrome c biogenesis protein transmembrane region n=1 Tax=Plocamium cartilagineum TaxID=31452 RepID=A0A1C9CHS4_PLOCA|nr:cytochrome c biogenesis protein transmembrane region [Plocamium cartilagineum]AOM67943.1 cytochrome c biogenesis protein transmembrane region [Plocamium cartilagineum]
MLYINNILSFFDIKLYYLQQKIYLLLSVHINNFTPTVFILLFLGGLLTSLNPCFISLLPITFSYIFGQKSKQINQNFFTLGIVTSSILIVSITLGLNNQYKKIISVLPFISSIFPIFIGLSLLQVFNLSVLFTYFNNIAVKINIKNSIIQDYLFGSILGLSISSCSTPILLTVLFWLSNTNQLIIGLVYLCCYLSGYIVPLLLLLNIFLKYNQLNKIVYTWNILIPISGSLVLGIGIFSFLENCFL